MIEYNVNDTCTRLECERFCKDMREELSIAYDHAHDLLARRDRGLA